MSNILSRFDESMLITWKIISFLSLNSCEQKKIIGECDNYFFEETDKNTGANYLYGILLMVNQYVVNDLFDELHPDVELVDKLKGKLNILIYDKKNISIGIKYLDCDEEWAEIRVISNMILSKLGLNLVPLKKPFAIEKFIEVDSFWLKY